MEDVGLVDRAGVRLREFTIQPGAPADGLRPVDLGLPEAALLILVHRRGEFLVPQGGTRLQAGDTVQVLLLPQHEEVVRAAFGFPPERAVRSPARNGPRGRLLRGLPRRSSASGAKPQNSRKEPPVG